MDLAERGRLCEIDHVGNLRRLEVEATLLFSEQGLAIRKLRFEARAISFWTLSQAMIFLSEVVVNDFTFLSQLLRLDRCLIEFLPDLYLVSISDEVLE